MVICLEQDADLHMAQLMPLPLTDSCFIKIQIGFTFLVPAHPGSPRQMAVKRVCVYQYFNSHFKLKLDQLVPLNFLPPSSGNEQDLLGEQNSIKRSLPGTFIPVLCNFCYLVISFLGTWLELSKSYMELCNKPIIAISLEWHVHLHTVKYREKMNVICHCHWKITSLMCIVILSVLAVL